MELKVSKDQSGLRLMDVIKFFLGKDLSIRKIKKLIDLQGCYVNAELTEISTRRVFSGDSIMIREEMLERVLEKHKIIETLFEDPYILIIDKPIGLCSNMDEISKILTGYKELYLIHRLDKETSGALILAKSLDIQTACEDLFRQRLVKKSYLAIVNGEISGNKGSISSHSYGRLTTVHGKDLWTGEAKLGGKFASTDWELIKLKDRLSFLRIFTQTGRTHQIRVHFSEMGYPIIGDPLYGKIWREDLSSNRMLLHAETLSFAHPVDHRKIEISSPLPSIFKTF